MHGQYITRDCGMRGQHIPRDVLRVLVIFFMVIKEKGKMMIQTRAINPTSCSNCRGKISIGQTYYKAGRGEHGQLCIDCYEFQNGVHP